MRTVSHHPMFRRSIAAVLAAGAFSGQAADSVSTQAIQTSFDLFGKLGVLSTKNFSTGTTNGFFKDLGTNGRTCGTCHVHGNAETLTPTSVRRTAHKHPTDPLFNPVDGSDCPPTYPGQPADATHSTMLLDYGVIRVQLGVPPGATYRLIGVTNPQNCAIVPGDPAVQGQLFLFRRPLPAANLQFLTTLMWDGRETVQKITTGPGGTNLGPLMAGLGSQANDATLGHAQATRSITGTQAQADILDFENGLYVAQTSFGPLDLTAQKGGPGFLANTAAPGFFVGQNDPLAPGFTSQIFTLYSTWEPGTYAGRDPLATAIGRGERIFNTRTFTIANVAGLNSANGDPLYNPAGPLGDAPFTGTCGTCHNTPNVGNHSTSLPVNIGVTMAIPRDNFGRPIPGFLDIERLPVYTLSRASDGQTVQVTDPGRALISGLWEDVGKTKGPILRGLAARAPYFHNGSAKDLFTLVKFYDARFNIGLTLEEKLDLTAFLLAL